MGRLKRFFTSENENILALFNVLGPLLLNGVNFLTLPIFTRLLTTENFGLISLYTTWVQVLTVFMGIQTFGSIAPARVHIPKEEHDRYYSSILSLSLLTTLGFSALMLVFLRPIAAFMEFRPVVVVMLILHATGMYFVNFVSMKYVHNKQASLHFLVSFSVTLSSLALALLLTIKVFPPEENYLGRIIGYAAPNFVIGLALAALVLKKGKTLYRREYWSYCLKLCLPLILHNLSQLVLSQSDRVMLQKLLGDETQVGIYSAIFTIAHIMNILYNALNNTWVPMYYDHLKAKELDTVKKRTGNYLFLFTALSVGFILLSPEVTRIIVREEYWSGISLIPVMVVSFYMMFLYSFPVNFEFFHKRTQIIAVGTVLSAGVNIGINALLIPRYGMMGAAVATMISYIALFFFHYFISRFAIGGEYFTFGLVRFLPGLAALGAAAAAFYLLADYWVVRWAIGAAVGVLLLWRVIRQKKIF